MEQESFLQSAQWQEFQEALGRQVWHLHGVLIIKHDLPLGKNYLYSPFPPVASIVEQPFLDELKEIAKKEKSIFFKVEPTDEFRASDFEFRKSSKRLQPQKTVILDITKSEDDLLGQMHQKTRYNLRLAQKKNLVVEQDNGQIEEFIKLLEQTAQRDKFYLHPRDFYRKMVKTLGPSGMVRLFLAKHQNQVIAANLVCFFGQAAYYLHGASDYNFRNLMAPYLLQWQAILQAKELGCKWYDLWGIDEGRWPGVTRFKRGFNGQEITHPGAFDLIFRPTWYKIYNLARKIL